MRDRAGAGAAEAHCARIGRGVGDQVLERVGLEVLADQQHHRRARHQHDRFEVDARIVGQILVQPDAGGMRAEISQHHGVAVGRRFGDAGGADRAAGTGDVLDHDLLGECLTHMLPENAGENVGRPAGRERHHHGDGARRIRLRCGGADAQRVANQCDRDYDKLSHDSAPVTYRTLLHFLSVDDGAAISLAPSPRSCGEREGVRGILLIARLAQLPLTRRFAPPSPRCRGEREEPAARAQPNDFTMISLYQSTAER